MGSNIYSLYLVIINQVHPFQTFIDCLGLTKYMRGKPTIINSKPILTKKREIIWRGCMSGGNKDSLRIRIVNHLKNNKYCDVQFTSDNNRLTPYQQSEYRAILMNRWK